MRISSGKSIEKNISMSVVSRIVTLITGLIVQHYILVDFGSTLNGLTSSISQVMQYLILLEAGLETASIQAMYSPLADNDWNKISGIFTATDVEYKKIARIFMLMLFAVSLILPFAVSSEVEYKIAAILTFVTGLSYVVGYIFGGKYKAVLSADRKMYILYDLDILSNVLSCVFRCLALYLGAGIILVQMVHLGSICVKNIGYVAYVKKKYKNIEYKAVPDLKAIGKRWSVLIHNIAGIVVNNTDIMILTIFGSLKTVSVYSVYNLVFGQLSTTIYSAFWQAPQASFGRIYNKDKKEFEHYYGIYETAFTVMLYIITAIALIMILPFVSVYTKGVTDINYIDFGLPILFGLILLMNQIRVPTLMTINVVGDFKETQTGAILEAVINLSVSLILFFFTDHGLYGLLIGTVASYIYRTTDVIVYTYRHILQRSSIILIRTIAVNSAVLVGLYVIFDIFYTMHTGSIWSWILKAIVVTIITIAAFFIGNYVFNHKEISKVISFGKSAIKNRLKK